MPAPGPVGTFPKIPQQVFQWCQRPFPVKSIPLIRKRQIEDSFRAEYPEHILQTQKRVLAVFQKMVGNDKILGGVVDTLQQFPVGHDINRHELLALNSGYCRRKSATVIRSTYRTFAHGPTLSGL
jgi:hypothetical protein